MVAVFFQSGAFAALPRTAMHSHNLAPIPALDHLRLLAALLVLAFAASLLRGNAPRADKDQGPSPGED